MGRYVGLCGSRSMRVMIFETSTFRACERTRCGSQLFIQFLGLHPKEANTIEWIGFTMPICLECGCGLFEGQFQCPLCFDRRVRERDKREANAKRRRELAAEGKRQAAYEKAQAKKGGAASQTKTREEVKPFRWRVFVFWYLASVFLIVYNNSEMDGIFLLCVMGGLVGASFGHRFHLLTLSVSVLGLLAWLNIHGYF